jgi:RNA polymerase sigma factor (sigma-70 family)
LQENQYVATVVHTQTMSDAELIGASRAGDSDAYAELYRRHVDSARAAARALCRNRSDADDVVSEAFVKMLRVLQSGHGPEVAFRPYLLTAVRNCFYDRTRRKDNDLAELPADDVNLTLIDSNASDDDKALAAAAFATLPERWQLVLWHTEVEGKSPAEVAPLLGLAPNAVAALAYRAREGLRQAFLQAHLRTPQPSECQECAGSLGAYVRDGLSTRDRRKVDDHLSQCDACKALLVELTDTNTTLRAALIPAIVGVPVAAYLSGLGGKGLLAWFLRMPRHQQAGTGAAAAAVVAVVAAAVVSAGGTAPGVAAPSTTRARAAVTTVVETSAPSTDTAPPTITIATTPSLTTPTVSVPVPSTVAVSVVPRPVTTLPKPRVTTTTRVTPTTPTPTTPPTGTDAPPAATTTVPPTTTVSPTTTVAPVVPKLTLTSTQIGSAITGGQARVRLDVVANALAANGLKAVDSVASVKAFANVVVSIPMLAGVTVQSTDNPAWSCTATGECTIATVAVGETSSAVIIINVAATVSSAISFAPTITTPPGAVVQSQPITVTPVTVPGLEFQEFAHGSVTAIGNTVLTCVEPKPPGPSCAAAQAGSGDKIDRFDFDMQLVGADAAAGIIDESSADLAITGTVVKALLVWSGEGVTIDKSPAIGTVKLTNPTGVTTDVVASKVRDDYNPSLAGEYVASADVTSLVSVGGTYTVANVQATSGSTSYGGWSLLVVTHDAAQPERMLLVTTPSTFVQPKTDTQPKQDLILTIPGTAGAASRDAHLVASAFEGDRGPTGDSAKLGDAPALVNAFGGRIGSVRNPSYENNFGVDVLDLSTTDVGAADLQFTVETADDRVMIAALGIALDLA